VESWDVIIVGGGIIGLSLAISLRKQGLRVLVVERGEPGREASYAAAGMLAALDPELPASLQPLAEESARLYPEFVHELEDESGIRIDLRGQGAIVLSRHGKIPPKAEPLSPQRLRSLEPALSSPNNTSSQTNHDIAAGFLNEQSVDPRALVKAALKAARHRQVDIASGSEVTTLLTEAGRVTGVRTERISYSAGIVVNCAGAWAGSFVPFELPILPVKGQMLAVVGGPPLAHVVRSKQVYLVPRSDGRIVIGSTLEDAGYDKHTDAATIKQLFHAAIELVPKLVDSKMHEAWAGLRPGTPDGLPILGETSTSGFFIAGGHYRDGILLAPITAKLTTALITDQPVRELQPFSPARF
jgi:glycine oxidase